MLIYHRSDSARRLRPATSTKQKGQHKPRQKSADKLKSAGNHPDLTAGEGEDHEKYSAEVSLDHRISHPSPLGL